MRAEGRKRPQAEVLGVYLAPTAAQSVRVGSLIRNQAAVTFLVDDSYIERGPERPILSLAFHAMSGEEDTIARLHDRRDKGGTINVLPPYFANLLPEGALRSVVEAQLPTGEDNEFGMLKRLGGDLPGAVVIRDEGAPEAALLDAAHARAHGSAENEEDAALVKFSLAGVQMKFSMVEAGDRLALPAHGESGGMIVKLASRDYPDLPEIEYGAMRLANAAGVATASTRLVPAAQVSGIKSNSCGQARMCSQSRASTGRAATGAFTRRILPRFWGPSAIRNTGKRMSRRWCTWHPGSHQTPWLLCWRWCDGS